MLLPLSGAQQKHTDDGVVSSCSCSIKSCIFRCSQTSLGMTHLRQLIRILLLNAFCLSLDSAHHPVEDDAMQWLYGHPIEDAQEASWAKVSNLLKY